MATLADNVIHLLFDSVDVKAYFTDVQLTESNSTNEVTAGSGVDYVQRAPGLSDTSMSVTLMYDVTNISAYVQKLKPGVTIPVVYGPEGNTAGKPRFECSMIVTSVKHSRAIDKSATQFSISLEGADSPTYTIHGGSTF